MTPETIIETIDVGALLDRVRSLRQQGHRLVQICAARLPDSFELTYSFDFNSRLTNLRIQLPTAEPHVPSICSIYRSVLLYENEIHDLFGIQVDGMAVDFHGKLYQTAIKFPLASSKAACATPPAAAPTT
jgi:ech hydrogenase subunit D